MSADKAGRPLAGMRILVAEDEPMTSALLENMLQELGAEVVGPVVSPQEAVRAAEAETLDAATLDVNLRGGRVYSAVAKLRKRGIPFVFVSGLDELPDYPADMPDAPRLKKPFRLNDIARALVEAINR